MVLAYLCMKRFAPLSAIVGLGIPLYLVTMSSQNMPGVVTLRADGYKPEVGQTITVTGLISLLFAPFGGFTFNLAAITAAICTGPDADEDKETRDKAALFAGLFYLLVGILGATVIGLFAILPKVFVFAIAALALLGTIGNSLAASLYSSHDREAAPITFMMIVSGINLFGIGAPFWALMFGLAVRTALRKA